MAARAAAAGRHRQSRCSGVRAACEPAFLQQLLRGVTVQCTILTSAAGHGAGSMCSWAAAPPRCTWMQTRAGNPRAARTAAGSMPAPAVVWSCVAGGPGLCRRSRSRQLRCASGRWWSRFCRRTGQPRSSGTSSTKLSARSARRSGAGHCTRGQLVAALLGVFDRDLQQHRLSHAAAPALAAQSARHCGGGSLTLSAACSWARCWRPAGSCCRRLRTSAAPSWCSGGAPQQVHHAADSEFA